MRQIFTLFLLIITSVCHGQAAVTDYVLSVDFIPSFIAPSKVVICSKQDTITIEFTIYKDTNKKELSFTTLATLATNDVQPIAAFSKTYLFSKNSWRDKLRMDTIVLNGNTMIVNTVGTDGITVNGTVTQDNIVKEFSFWSPRKESENQKLMELIFSLLYQSFPEERATNYFEQLEGYFSFGLGLKKTSDDPLKYKLYGSISSHEEKEITNFINDLPFDKPVFIDLSNFNGMGTMYYPLFKSLIEKNSSIFWEKPSPKGLQQLYEIGIPTKNIIN